MNLHEGKVLKVTDTKILPNKLQKDYAYRVIREKIINWELLPGSTISEARLAEELGMSRVPVREALKDLSKTKIVEIYPQRGTKIAPLDYDLVNEAEFFRRVVESAVVELACGLITGEDIEWFEEQLELQAFYWVKDLPQKLAELDTEYHMRYYKISKKIQCYQFVEDMNIHFDRIRHVGYIMHRDLHLVDDHRRIFEAVKRGDPEEAKACLVEHLVRYQTEKEETFQAAQKIIEKARAIDPSSSEFMAWKARQG